MALAPLKKIKDKVPSAPPAVRDWTLSIRTRHLRVLIRHPHHYATAFGLTVFLFLIGHFEAGAIWGAWGYALVENLSTAGEDR